MFKDIISFEPNGDFRYFTGYFPHFTNEKIYDNMVNILAQIYI